MPRDLVFEKRFPCEQCGLSFTFAINLSEHLKHCPIVYSHAKSINIKCKVRLKWEDSTKDGFHGAAKLELFGLWNKWHMELSEDASSHMIKVNLSNEQLQSLELDLSSDQLTFSTANIKKMKVYKFTDPSHLTDLHVVLNDIKIGKKPCLLQAQVAPKGKHCPECGKQLNSNKTLRNHMRTVHNAQIPMVRGPKTTDPSYLSCTDCGKAFNTRKNLTDHRRIHRKK